ncbi:hypothetical protein N7454_010996 [Penicillium verhagenii]|nr:hypothetical protein N7454_010996 [Penicillium verhagenii]
MSLHYHHQRLAWRTISDCIQADRLAYLEEKVNLILSGKGTSPPDQNKPQQQDNQDLSYSASSGPSSNEFSGNLNEPFFGLGYDDTKAHTPLEFPAQLNSISNTAIDNRYGASSEKNIITLTSRFSQDRDEIQQYGDTARTLVMLRIANGTIELETIESLCLLSYSSFLDGDGPLGRFHLGLALQLCRSAMLDLNSTYGIECPSAERKKRLFWSLQSLEQTYGQIGGILSVQAEVLRSFYLSTGSDELLEKPEHHPPPLPNDTIGCTSISDIGIWNLALHFGWVWNRVRSYVFDCAQSKLTEPWRHDSMYAMVLSDLTELENKLSLCHRYDSVKFYERRPDELRGNRDYWASWLKLQFTYHTILTVLNHPFLYIVASQYNHKLTIPNTFWRRSSEVVMLHATWIVRMIDMVTDKKMRLIDPFFGHAAAIAATDRTLDKMTRIASGSEKVDFDWEPSKIHLSIPLMWDVLQISCLPTSDETPSAGLLHPSLMPVIFEQDKENSASTVEVIVAMSPDITVNTTDGGSAAHVPPKMPRIAVSAPTSPTAALGDKLVAPADSLMANAPWLWADPSQFVDMETLGYPESESTFGNIDGFSTWWDFGNL